MKRFGIPLALAFGLAACGTSAPLRYYTLDPVPPAAPAAALAGPALQVGRITLPAPLDRVQMVRHAGADRLDIDDRDHWAGPLDDLLREALTRDLALRLPGRVVPAGGEAIGAEPRQVLTLAVEAFDADSAGHVVLEARWTLLSGPADTPVAAQGERVTLEAGGADAAAMAEAMSRAVGLLADRIAGAIPGRRYVALNTKCTV